VERPVPIRPFVFTLVVIALDQLLKWIIVARIPLYGGFSILNDLVRIVHARNLGIAFSIGNSFPEAVRKLLFIVMPVFVMIALLVYYVRSKELTGGMRWALAGILGGGVGNLIDRIFRPLGVVDFVHVKVYGLFGMERWPVFNLADSTVVVCGIALVVLSFLSGRTPHGTGTDDTTDGRFA
jgi:signal peptidase II